MSSEVPIRPAATVICLRNASAGLEVLLVRRNARLVFHGGAWVFPGGRVDDQDAHGAEPFTEDAARIAAVRETAEEASLAIAADALVPLSHWTTPAGMPRRFSTWFFLVDARRGTVSVDDGEIDEHWWARPDVAIAKRDAGEIELPPPTFVSLTWLERIASVEDALDIAHAQRVERFVPRPVLRPNGVVSLYHGDCGYETSDPEIEGPRHRLWMLEDEWHYERGG